MDEMRSKLFYEQKNGYDLIDTAERLALEEYNKGYMEYLNVSRTEREAVNNAIAMAEELGFVPFVPGMELRPGTKVYRNIRGKSLVLAVMGKKSLAEGCVIAGAHVDAPRLDLKPNPLYEDIPTRRGSTSSRSRFMKRAVASTSTATFTAASRNTSGSPSLWSSTVW